VADVFSEEKVKRARADTFNGNEDETRTFLMEA